MGDRLRSPLNPQRQRATNVTIVGPATPDPNTQLPGSPEAESPEAAAITSLATVLTATPSLRAKFFADPTRQIGRTLPPRKYWSDDLSWERWHWLRSYQTLRKARAHLAKDTLLRVAKEVTGNQLTSTINTDAVFEDFFAPIVRVSQRSFNTVFLLSWGAFLAGLGLIASGVYIAIASPGGTNSTIVGSIFGGSGAVSALGAVYAMAKQGIREATTDHARLRVVLTAFATQLGQLRGIAESPAASTPPADMNRVKLINRYIGETMAAALGLIPSPMEAKTNGARAPEKTAEIHSRRNDEPTNGSGNDRPQ